MSSEGRWYPKGVDRRFTSYARRVLDLLLALQATPTERLSDRGIFPDLNEKVAIRAPEWIRDRPIALYADAAHDTLIVTVDGHAIATFPAHADRKRCSEGLTLGCFQLSPSHAEALSKFADASAPVNPPLGEHRPWIDTDADGIPDSVDILLGAKKVVLDAAPYVEHYLRLDYPGGDVPRTEGVCTDVIVRALRNMGIDLQAAVHQDAGANPQAYPAIRKLDSNIDHRRISNLVRWFARHFERMNGETVLPGDVVFLDTFPSRPGADHVGIVSDSLGPSGKPLIINAWTTGYVASEMDLLAFVPIESIYRSPHSPK